MRTIVGFTDWRIPSWGIAGGGLALATIAGCGFFGSICGYSPATAATFGRVALPEMLRRKEKKTC